MQKILILGATSAIAQETARLYAAQGCRLYLLGRNEAQLATIAADLTIRGATLAEYAAHDLNDTRRHAALLDDAVAALGGLDVALLAYGTLTDQDACAHDFAAAQQELITNFVSPVSWLTHLANYLEPRRQGCLAVLSSVAGDRGRQSNYVYGAAKGGLTVFLQGLRNRLYNSGVQVLTIKPGPVDTPMTAHMRKGLLFAKPTTVARDIIRAIENRRHVLYTPWFWRWIMLIIQSIPEWFFIRLRL